MVKKRSKGEYSLKEWKDRKFQSKIPEDIRKIQTEILELKNTKCEIRIPLDGFNSRMVMTKVKVSELADRPIEIIQHKPERGKDWGEN